MKPDDFLRVIIVVAVGFPIMYGFYKMNVKKIIEIAKTKYIFPALKKDNLTFTRIELCKGNILHISKDKGDFEDYKNNDSIFDDTNFNRKFYCYLYYLDELNIEHKCTVKIHTDFSLAPIKVEFKPSLL